MKRALDPIDRVSEVLFGLIMVLTFTGSLSVAEAGREDVRTMLIGALGCNLAWGIIDAVFYLMGCLAEKGHGLLTLPRRARGHRSRAARSGSSRTRCRRVVASVLEPAELEADARAAEAAARAARRARGSAGTTGGAPWGCSCSCSCPRSRW